MDFFSFLLAGCLVMTRLLTFAHPIDRIHMFDTYYEKKFDGRQK